MAASRPPRRGDVVEVEWLDSEHIALGWRPTRAYRRAGRRPQSYRTAGYWFPTGNERVLIVQSLSPANGHVTHAMSIPAVAVTKVIVLGRAAKRVRRALA